MTKKIAVVGIDPGKTGALCLLIPETKQIAFKDTTDTALNLLKWFQQIDKEYNLIVCMIEDVSSIPGSSAKANFSFGANVERVHVIPEVAEISIDVVRPKVWQKFIGLTVPKHLKGEANKAKRKTFIKQTVADIGLRLYPKAELHGPKGGLKDGRSDALMIAHYAARTINI